MPMKNPSHPGELVRDNLEDLNLTVAEAATGLGITRQQLYNVIGGKCAITPEMALRFAEGLRWDRDVLAANAGKLRLGAGAREGCDPGSHSLHSQGGMTMVPSRDFREAITPLTALGQQSAQPPGNVPRRRCPPDSSTPSVWSRGAPLGNPVTSSRLGVHVTRTGLSDGATSRGGVFSRHQGASMRFSTSSEKSIFPRVAWLYGQTFSCASSNRATASSFGSVGAFTCIPTAIPKPPPSRGPTEV